MAADQTIRAAGGAPVVRRAVARVSLARRARATGRGRAEVSPGELERAKAASLEGQTGPAVRTGPGNRAGRARPARARRDGRRRRAAEPSRPTVSVPSRAGRARRRVATVVVVHRRQIAPRPRRTTSPPACSADPGYGSRALREPPTPAAVRPRPLRPGRPGRAVPARVSAVRFGQPAAGLGGPVRGRLTCGPRSFGSAVATATGSTPR